MKYRAYDTKKGNKEVTANILVDSQGLKYWLYGSQCSLVADQHQYEVVYSLGTIYYIEIRILISGTWIYDESHVFESKKFDVLLENDLHMVLNDRLLTKVSKNGQGIYPKLGKEYFKIHNNDACYGTSISYFKYSKNVIMVDKVKDRLNNLLLDSITNLSEIDLSFIRSMDSSGLIR